MFRARLITALVASIGWSTVVIAQSDSTGLPAEDASKMLLNLASTMPTQCDNPQYLHCQSAAKMEMANCAKDNVACLCQGVEAIVEVCSTLCSTMYATSVDAKIHNEFGQACGRTMQVNLLDISPFMKKIMDKGGDDDDEDDCDNGNDDDDGTAWMWNDDDDYSSSHSDSHDQDDYDQDDDDEEDDCDNGDDSDDGTRWMRKEHEWAARIDRRSESTHYSNELDNHSKRSNSKVIYSANFDVLSDDLEDDDEDDCEGTEVSGELHSDGADSDSEAHSTGPDTSSELFGSTPSDEDESMDYDDMDEDSPELDTDNEMESMFQNLAKKPDNSELANSASAEARVGVSGFTRPKFLDKIPFWRSQLDDEAGEIEDPERPSYNLADVDQKDSELGSPSTIEKPAKPLYSAPVYNDAKNMSTVESVATPENTIKKESSESSEPASERFLYMKGQPDPGNNGDMHVTGTNEAGKEIAPQRAINRKNSSTKHQPISKSRKSVHQNVTKTNLTWTAGEDKMEKASSAPDKKAAYTVVAVVAGLLLYSIYL